MSLKTRPVFSLRSRARGRLARGATSGMANEPAADRRLPLPDGLRSSAEKNRPTREKLFYDPSLSGNGQIFCATCHDPNNHYAPVSDRAVFFLGRAASRPAGHSRRAEPRLQDGDAVFLGRLGKVRPTKRARPHR